MEIDCGGKRRKGNGDWWRLIVGEKEEKEKEIDGDWLWKRRRIGKGDWEERRFESRDAMLRVCIETGHSPGGAKLW